MQKEVTTIYERSIPNRLAERIKAIIFDLDGTLVSSSLDFAQMRKDLGCPSGEDILTYIEALSADEQSKARAIVYRHEMADAQSVKLLPGVKELLEMLSGWNMRTAIVTRNSREATRKKLQQVALELDTVLTRECAPAKPHPGALLQLCQEWNISADQAVYVGDYLYDLLAAENAQMHSCLYVQDSVPDYAEKAGFVCQDYSKFFTLFEAYLSGLERL